MGRAISGVLTVLSALLSTLVVSCGGGDDELSSAGPPNGGPGGDAAAVDAAVEGLGPTEGGDAAPPSLAPWVVFTQAGPSAPMSANRLVNPDCEAAQGALLQSWTAFGSGYVVGAGEGRSGNAIKLVRNAGDTAAYGAHQSVALDQVTARPIYFSGWSKAADVTGDPDNDTSIYLDIAYKTKTDDPQNGCEPTAQEPCSLWGQVPAPRFDTGTHDWQQRDGFAVPAYPIKDVSYYVLLRGTHTGTAWYDDLVLEEVDASILAFDDRLVSTVKPTVTYAAGPELGLATGDGLSLSVFGQGATAGSVKLDGTDVLRKAFDYGSGFILHEADASDWWAAGGYATASGSDVVQHADVAPLGITLDATLTASQDSIRVHAQVRSTSAQDRALTLYWALPIEASGWSWGDDIRTQRTIGGVEELASLTSFWGTGDLGATSKFSRFPFAAVSTAGRGLAIGYPLDQTRIARIVHNPVTGQLYVAWDLGLSPDTTKFPSSATADLVLYHTSPASPDQGFRAALQGFYDRFPEAFARRIPVAKEGVWVAFADLSKVQNGAGESVEDFHVGFHESSESDVAFDDQHGIQTFRYVIEPASTWLAIDDASVDPHNKAQVAAFLQKRFQSGTPSQQTEAAKTLSSVLFDRDGAMAYEPYDQGPPWCSGPCALFYLSADPDIQVPPYTVNQATYHWNDAAKQTYTTTPGLDGEYIDSFVMEAKRPNFRREHFAAADTPLTFTFDEPHAVVIPVIFSTLELTRWLRPQLPKDKYLIANAVLIGVPWGADLFDFMGQEIDWVQQVSGQYQIVPEEDGMLSYRRAMAGQRPYGFLMNTDFANMSKDMVERYMRICLFYGIYPSMFSANASQGNYFETPALYERDRPLFQRYIPIIQSLNAGGWHPLTRASSSSAQVYIERFGDWPSSLYLTLRNMSDLPVTVTVQLDRAALGMTGAATVRSLVLGAADVALDAGAGAISVTLPALDIEALQIVQ